MLVVLLGLSFFAWARAWTGGHPSSTLLCQCGDPGQAVWFMAWVPYAIAHGHNPLFTTAMLANEGGANLLQSTSYLLPSFLLAPVTWLFGATVAFNVVSLLTPVVSGYAMFLALHRVAQAWVAQAAGALLWGLSPFDFAEAIFGHLNLSLLFFPPLLFMLLLDLAADDRRDPRLVGVLLGLLVVAQFFAGTEQLAITAVAAAAGLLVAAALAPRAAWGRRRRILTGVAVAVALAGSLLAYPLWFLLAGPRHVVGQPWPGISLFGAHPADIIRAGDVHAVPVLGWVAGYLGARGPNASFLGLGLLVLLGVSNMVWARRRVAWVVAVTGVVAWVLSLGTVLTPLGPSSGQFWLLWRDLQHLPLLSSVSPGRFVLVVVGAAAVLLALSIDGWLALAGALRVKLRQGSRTTAAVAPLALVAVVTAGVVVAALPIVSAFTWPLAMQRASTPLWFTTAARHLDPGTIVLTYPYASSSTPDAMYWQAENGLSFRLAGGRALIPGSDGRHSQHVSPISGLDAVLDDASYGVGVPAVPGPAEVTRFRSTLATWRIGLVVVAPAGRSPAWAAAVFTAVLGRPPALEDGSWVWRGVGDGRQPRYRLAAAALAACIGSGSGGGAYLAAPGCVMRSMAAARATASAATAGPVAGG